ncbi:MAG: IS110 family transposase [Phycisphaerales bacterium]|nr:IS110 family transposase [Phycisphaerales bacterium]
MLYIGLDVHYRSSAMCILNNNGKVVKEIHIRDGLPKVLATLRALKQRFAICYEASCGYGVLYDGLRGLAKRIVVAHPGQLRLIFKAKKKSDRVDAKKLALLLYLDQVPQAYVPSVNVREWRSLIEFRHRLVGKRTRAKNSLRSLLRGQGIHYVRGRSLWTHKGRTWLAGLELPVSVALQRDLLLEEFDRLNKQILRVEQTLDDQAEQQSGVALLRTIPGVGVRTAEAVVAYIADPKRFSRNRTIGSYFGLVPCLDQSAGLGRFGHITREGPPTVRKLLVEATWQGIRRSTILRRYFERIQRGERDRRKIALVATAHHLARVMLAMLTTGEIWRHDGAGRMVAA